MKNIKILLPIVVLVVLVFVYSFFHIDGREIKFIDKLSEANTVTVMAVDEENGEQIQYDFNTEQVEQLKKLMEESSYVRRVSSTIVGELPKKRYTIFAGWDDNGQKNLQISLLGGEYIQFLGEYGSHYHKIKDSEFEKALISILINRSDNYETN